MFCSRCGSEVTGKSKFCPSCGLDLLGATPADATGSAERTELDVVREGLSAEYEILEELGRGGMALVYRAKDRHLEREVAIKVLPFSLAFDAEFVERFQREARTSAQLEHPNIIPIYRVGRAGRVIHFAMKFLRGGSLSAVLGERRKLTPPEIRRLLLEAGSALGYAAQRGVVHRDIKPDNIMFDEFGQCVLTDFGIAKAASGQKLTGTGMSIGTPHYMSPEQARAQPTDGRSDIYSLGVVAYQCLVGMVPYDGEDSFSIGYKHITEPIPTPALATGDERRLFEVIRRMLMKDPQERFQHCEELTAALQGQAIAAPGTVRASAAVLSMAAAGAVAVATPPALASQPTTPLTSAAVNRRVERPERRAEPRRVADRSVALRSGEGFPAWVWTVVAVFIGSAGALYYYLSRDLVPMSIAAPAGIAADSPRRASDTTATQAGLVPDTLPGRTAAESMATESSTATGSSAPAGDSSGIPATASVGPTGKDSAASVLSTPSTIDSEGTPAGRAGPGPTAVIEAQPAALPTCRAPTAGYNADRSCYDVRPLPKEPTFVPLPSEIQSPARPSILWVRVSPDGKTLEVRRYRPSDNPAFEQAARAYAADVEWNPATKGGAAIEAWTQWPFSPLPR